MALGAGEYRTGGRVFDQDGYPIVKVSGGAGGGGDTELPAAAALAEAMANPTAPAVAAHGMVWNGATWDRARSPADAIGATGLHAVSLMVTDGATYRPARHAQALDGTSPAYAVGAGLMALSAQGILALLRTSSVFKSLASTAITAGTGATIWTPAASRKFRVLGICISSSVAGQLLLGDNVVGTVIARSPTLAAGGVWVLGQGDLGNGILSAAANNVLKIDGPTGNVAGMVWGVDE